MPDDTAIVVVQALRVTFPGPAGVGVDVVRGIDLELRRRRILGLVGESGSGKSMTALSLLGLVPEPGRVSGSIRLERRELTGLTDEAWTAIRGKTLAIVFQDPASALNPVFTIGRQLTETIRQHMKVSETEARALALERLRQVDIPSPEQRLDDYPHQFSGGMKQRILIAMALSCRPDLLILDEPTTALDVTVQAQILDLIEKIQTETTMAILLISHDLGIIAEVADDILVMYAGQIVESGPAGELLRRPRHPYTRGLLDSIPRLGAEKQRLGAIPGNAPNPAALPAGCPFHPRCARALARCRREDPLLETDGDRRLACWHPEDT